MPPLCRAVALQILGNVTEFQRVVAVLQEGLDFDIDVNASVFETNIRGEVGCAVLWGSVGAPGVQTEVITTGGGCAAVSGRVSAQKSSSRCHFPSVFALHLTASCLGVPGSYTCRSQYPLPSFKLCCQCIFRGNSVDSVHSLLTSCFGRRVVDLLLWCCKIKLVFLFPVL